MALINAKHDLQLKVTFEISEEEAQALNVISQYGDEAFIKAFAEKLSPESMRLHNKGLRKFLKSCRESIPRILEQTEMARKTFKK
jgi:hypothetical protein